MSTVTPRPTLDALLAAMKGAPATNGWDVVASYSLETINHMLASQYAARQLIDTITVTSQGFDPHEKSTYTLTTTLILGSPLLQFIDGESGKCELTMPVLDGSNYTIDGVDPTPIPANSYTVYCALPLIAVSGSTGTVTPHGAPVQFIQGTPDEHHIVLDFKSQIDTVYQVKLDDGVVSNDQTLQLFVVPELAAWFADNVTTLQYALTSVNNDAPNNDIVLQPLSFVFGSAGSGDDGVLSVYIQTVDSGNPQGNLSPSFQPGDTAMLPLPATYGASIIFARDLIVKGYLAPQLGSPAGYTATPVDTDDGIQFNIAIDRQIIKNATDTDFWGGITVDTLDADLTADPVRFTLRDGAASLTWDFQQALGWQEDGMGTIQPWGTVDIDIKLAKSMPITVGDHTIGVAVAVTKADYTITASGEGVHWYDKLSGGTSDVPSQLQPQNLQLDLPSISLSLDNLQYFPTTNVLFPGKHVITVDTTVGLHTPHDVMLVGQIDTTLGGGGGGGGGQRARFVERKAAAAPTPPPAPYLVPSETYREVRDATGTLTVILSADDDNPLVLADGTQLTSGLAIFAESLVLAGHVAAPALRIATHTLTGGDGATLDASGTAGTDYLHQDQPQGDGLNGGDGVSAGGTLALHVERLGATDTPVRLLAHGGDGGRGEDAAEGRGGNGGSGKPGGTITVGFSALEVELLDRLADLRSTDPPARQVADAGDFVTALAASADLQTGFAAPLAALAPLLAATTPDLAQIAAALRLIGLGLSARVDTLRVAYQTSCDVSGGRRGAHGVGAVGPDAGPGTDGSDGAGGTLTVAALDLSDSSQLPTDRIVVHPDQCDMLLARARAAYFAGSDDAVAAASVMFDRLLARTAFVDGLAATAPLAQLYATKGAADAITGGIAQLTATRQLAATLAASVAAGTDYFGHEDTWVPLVSVGEYRELVESELADYQTIESAYVAYQQAAGDQAAVMAAVTNGRDRAHQTLGNLAADLDDLAADAGVTARAIAAYGPLLATQKAALEAAIDLAADDLASAFTFNFKDLVSALTTTAFAPNGFMAALQGGNLVYGAATQITDDQGVDVDKSYLVSQIRSVAGSVDSLLEGFRLQSGGTLSIDDPGAAKLIALRDQLMTTLANVSGALGGDLAAVKTAFDVYVKSVIARNGQVMRYNAIITTALQKRAQQRATQGQLTALTDQALAAARPDLPALSTFMGALYRACRDRVLTSLYGAARAYRFWALSDRDLFGEAFGGTTAPDLSSPALTSVHSDLVAALDDALGSFGTPPQHFPAVPTDPGIMVELAAADVDTLRTTGQVTFQLPPVYPETGDDESALAGFYDIRISTLRVWLGDAVAPGHRCLINITHGGDEDIVDKLGQSYHFTHDPITVSFEYVAGSPAVITVDGTFADATTAGYAPVGPFTTWTITLDPSYHPVLPLAGLIAVQLELHGTSYAFPR